MALGYQFFTNGTLQNQKKKPIVLTAAYKPKIYPDGWYRGNGSDQQHLFVAILDNEECACLNAYSAQNSIELKDLVFKDQIDNKIKSGQVGLFRKLGWFADFYASFSWYAPLYKNYIDEWENEFIVKL